MEAFPTPSTKAKVQCFLGLTGYYRKFISGYADIAAPLTDLTRRSAPRMVEWNQKCERAFRELKTLLCSNPVLQSPDLKKEFILHFRVWCWCSPSQLDNSGTDHPVCFFSRKLLPREQQYSTIEKECLAIKLATQAFRVYLLEKPFTVQTDHRWLDKVRESKCQVFTLEFSFTAFPVCDAA